MSMMMMMMADCNLNPEAWQKKQQRDKHELIRRFRTQPRARTATEHNVWGCIGSGVAFKVRHTSRPKP